MRIAIAGGHGRIARRLSRLLVARGDVPVAIVRNLDHVADVQSDGAEPVVLDLESVNVHALADAIAGADAVVFAAGAGPGSGAARKETVDRGAAALLADAAERSGVRRYVLVSSLGTTTPTPQGTDEVFAAYLRAKAASEADLRRRDLEWTIVRPGLLTDHAPGGLVELAPTVRRGPVSRDDVAAVLVAVLHEPGTARRALELVSGEVPVEDAVRAAAA